MPFDLGTYGSSVYGFTPSNILPEPIDDLTWDWMDVVGQWTQRFRKMATVIATVASTGTYTFQYQALRCDYFPPILKAYYYNTAATQWDRFVGNAVGAKWQEIGLGTAKLVNHTGASRAFLMMAYL